MLLDSKLEKISYSNLAMFVQCPRRWKLHYIDKVDERKESIDTLYGTSMHETIQDFLKYYYTTTLKELKDNRENDINRYGAFFVNRMIANYNESKKETPEMDISDNQIEKYFGFAFNCIEEFIPKVNKYFPKLNTELYGIEVELNEKMEGLQIPFKGFLDIVLHDKKEDRYKIIDLKTSMMGWKDAQKKDEMKRLQLILYKHFFAKKHNIPEDNIDIEFIILKKMVFENAEFKISRIQKFEPPNAKVTMKKGLGLFYETINEMEKLVESGGDGRVSPSKLCGWCPFEKRPDLCLTKPLKVTKKLKLNS